jgi:hypothetical protein
MCYKWGRLARETCIKVSPYGILFQCSTRSSGQVRRGLQVIGLLGKCVASGGDLQGKLPSLLVGHWFSVVIGLQARFDEVFYLLVRCCTSVRLSRWCGCTSCCYIWWPLAEFHP